MKPISCLLAVGVLPVLLMVAACSAPGRTSSGATTANPVHHDPSTTHRHGKADPSEELSAALLRVADLPRGYRGRMHHQAGAERPPDVADACTPIGEIIGAHHSARQHQHPQARVSFSKSHFGPELSETIIDYGGPSAAARALRRFKRAGHDCVRYTQSTSPAGANTYTVAPTTPLPGGEGTAALRLTAVGRQFPRLFWDVWVTRSGSRLTSVAFRSVPRGDNDDWYAAIHAARRGLGG